MQDFHATIAQGGDPTKLLLWIGILIVAVVLLFVVLMLAKRKLLGPDKPSAADRGLLDDLRRMRDAGEITPEEYDAARKSMAAKIAGKPTPKPKPTHAGPEHNTHG
ncbi:MAG: hypothetical protein HBSAPP03_22880 [Phycisphaerae bacterium]|nr:MAG: hypothetical protein HBSAPP03_22880 [Phycisphaerae bacterium]